MNNREVLLRWELSKVRDEFLSELNHVREVRTARGACQTPLVACVFVTALPPIRKTVLAKPPPDIVANTSAHIKCDTQVEIAVDAAGR